MNAPSAPKKEQLILLVSCFIPDMLLNLSSNLGYVHTYEKYLKKYLKAPVPANKGTRLLLLKINQCLPSPPSHLRTKARLARPPTPSCCLTKITLGASTCWSSSQARVTSAKSLSPLKFPKAQPCRSSWPNILSLKHFSLVSCLS